MNISKSSTSTAVTVLSQEIYQLNEKIKMFLSFESDHSDLINFYQNQIIELTEAIDFLKAN